MPTSAAGNKPGAPQRPGLAAPPARPRGFTLVELLVVIALIAIVSASASLALRDSAGDALERDAQRLAALLESARAQSRASGAPVFWQAQGQGFVLQGLPRPSPAQAWLSEHTRAQVAGPVVLGPEPLIAPQRIVLYSTQTAAPRMLVATDGLRPFSVARDTSAVAP